MAEVHSRKAALHNDLMRWHGHRYQTSPVPLSGTGKKKRGSKG